MLFVRHGETASNRAGRYAGQAGEGLTEEGIRQAHAAAGRLKTYAPRSLYTSPLRRGVETAGIIGNQVGLVPIPTPGFSEMRLGPWEGMYESDVAEQYPEEWHVWNTQPKSLRLPGRETLEEVLERVLSAIGMVTADGENNRTVAVTHVAIIRVLLLYTNGLDLDLYRTVPIPNGAIFDCCSGRLL